MGGLADCIQYCRFCKMQCLHSWESVYVHARELKCLFPRRRKRTDNEGQKEAEKDGEVKGIGSAGRQDSAKAPQFLIASQA